MRKYRYSLDYDDPLIAELYDQSQTSADDVELIRRLIGTSEILNILECFSGTGRILVRLAQDGHVITGIEIAPSMIALASQKVAMLGEQVQRRVTFKIQDVLDGDWGSGYDLVIMGANAFYELPSAETQERCIRFAQEALRLGGRLFIDNADYKGDWDKEPVGKEQVIFEGTGADGTFGCLTLEHLRFDVPKEILHMRRTWFTRTPGGTEKYIQYLTRKHPANSREVEGWLTKHKFQILQIFGDRQGNPYKTESERAIFWAEKTQSP
jgi:predicted O-methyltransferase YrrM